MEESLISSPDRNTSFFNYIDSAVWSKRIVIIRHKTFNCCVLYLIFWNNLLECKNDQFKCTNGRCISKMFLLDGHDDCKDNSDEQNPNVTGEVFMYTEYKLNIHVQYIVKGKLFYF